jgi:CheY-like chemotaxis protein
MPTPPSLRVAIHGFGEFEAATLASALRLASRPARPYEPVRELARAQVIVAAADQARVVGDIVAGGRSADTVFIGGHAPPGAGAWLPRPIDPLQLPRAIDALAARRGAAPAAGAAGTTAPAPGRAAARALLVDDSAIALRHLQLRLQRRGIDTELATSSARAMELLAQRAFGYVFIDVELGEGSALDGLALCQHIRRQHHPVDGAPPVLVIVSAHHGELDRARGTLAGADHYLPKPATDAALADLFAQRRRPRPAGPRPAAG